MNISLSYTYQIKEDRDLKVKVLIEKVIYKNPTYGHKRIAIDLSINKKKVLRIMHKYGIKPTRRRIKKPIKKDDLNKPESINKNIIKNICPITTGIIWIQDFTYLKYKNKFVYLATVMDLYSREVVGICISLIHNDSLVIEALKYALIRCKSPQICHSDQGSEYDSIYEKICKDNNILVSMSHKGSPWENGFQESFYSHFKVELADPDRFESQGELIEEIYRIIFYYNN